jgi:hypothetical protein
MKSSLIVFLTLLILACGTKKEHSSSPALDSVTFKQGSFGYDVEFIKKHKEVIVLGSASGGAKILVVKDYQARIMTSTASGDEGYSYGWINYDLIKSGKGLPHMNAFGGEDRVWLGPEGGQYSLYFKKGDPFEFANWQTPPVIDSETYDLISSDSTQASFRKLGSLTNYNGYTFNFEINRQVRLLTDGEVLQEFGIASGKFRSVAYESRNSLTNTGTEIWKKKNGLVSIWILGMYKPSDKTMIIIPHEKLASGASEKGKITDNYFGQIPADRIAKKEDVLLLKADGKSRGKVGIAPTVAKNISGSYNTERHILTLVKFDLEKNADYVNSKWEIQKQPFKGDVANAYNDGPVADGTQMGPFYELESSSPAKELNPGGTVTHHHRTLHLEGDEAALDDVARKILGISLTEIEKSFSN